MPELRPVSADLFQALGHREIPAIVVEVCKEDRLLRSLVEKMAPRMIKPLDPIREIVRLKEQGDSNVQISRKLDIGDTVVGGLLALHKAGEERLLEAALAVNSVAGAPGPNMPGSGRS